MLSKSISFTLQEVEAIGQKQKHFVQVSHPTNYDLWMVAMDILKIFGAVILVLVLVEYNMEVFSSPIYSTLMTYYVLSQLHKRDTESTYLQQYSLILSTSTRLRLETIFRGWKSLLD